MGVRRMFCGLVLALMVMVAGCATDHPREASQPGDYWLQQTDSADDQRADSVLGLLAVAASALGVGVTCWVVLSRGRL